MRYKRHLPSALVDQLDSSTTTNGVTRTTATLANSGRVPLTDVTRIIQEEWAKTTSVSLGAAVGFVVDPALKANGV